MPKIYMGLEIPQLNKDISEIQQAHCDQTTKCVDHCANCIYDTKNIKQFTDWFNSKRYYGK